MIQSTDIRCVEQSQSRTAQSPGTRYSCPGLAAATEALLTNLVDEGLEPSVAVGSLVSEWLPILPAPSEAQPSLGARDLTACLRLRGASVANVQRLGS